MEYGPWESTPGALGGQRFAGQKGYQNDPATGMQLLGARYYLPRLGRFLTPDPIGHEGGLNLYAYCDDSPLLRVDPSGTAESNLKFSQVIPRFYHAYVVLHDNVRSSRTYGRTWRMEGDSNEENMVRRMVSPLAEFWRGVARSRAYWIAASLLAIFMASLAWLASVESRLANANRRWNEVLASLVRTHADHRTVINTVRDELGVTMIQPLDASKRLGTRTSLVPAEAIVFQGIDMRVNLSVAIVIDPEGRAVSYVVRRDVTPL